MKKERRAASPIILCGQRAGYDKSGRKTRAYFYAVDGASETGRSAAAGLPGEARPLYAGLPCGKKACRTAAGLYEARNSGHTTSDGRRYEALPIETEVSFMQMIRRCAVGLLALILALSLTACSCSGGGTSSSTTSSSTKT